MRVEEGAVRRTSNGGYLHLLGGANPRPSCAGRRAIHVPSQLARRGDLAALAHSYGGAVTPGLLRALADCLGVSERSLRRLRTGWAFDGGRGRFEAGAVFDAGDVLRATPSAVIWSFPMLAADGRVVGVRLRHPDGSKTAVAGSRDGLFLPDGLLLHGADVAGAVRQRRLLVAEGASDCAALLDLGFEAVGRPSCTGGVRPLTALLSARRPAEVVVFSDVDGHGAGQRGAESLAAVFVAYCPAVRLVCPPRPYKDVREWVVTGRATADEVRAAVEAAPVRRLSVRMRTAGPSATSSGGEARHAV